MPRLKKRLWHRFCVECNGQFIIILVVGVILLNLILNTAFITGVINLFLGLCGRIFGAIFPTVSGIAGEVLP